jgi:large subunit ribosomal protein L17
MQKRRKGRKLSRKTDQRKALLKTLAVSLISKEKIKTTEAKAKELAGFVEKLITRSKTDNVQARRILAGSFGPILVKKMVAEIGPRYKDRKGGYVRIIKLGSRKSDSGRMAIIELVK